MDVLALPFNRLLGLERAAPESGSLVSLPASANHTNHLGSVHAIALLAVAEAGAAELLLRHLGDAPGYLPLVRRVDVKFRHPVQGRVFARSTIPPTELAACGDELRAKGRVLIHIPIEVVDEAGTVAVNGTIEWFIVREEGPAPAVRELHKSAARS
jgi:acyl-coenzyme A thioesterase PaaI-like protein